MHQRHRKKPSALMGNLYSLFSATAFLLTVIVTFGRNCALQSSHGYLWFKQITKAAAAYSFLLNARPIFLDNPL